MVRKNGKVFGGTGGLHINAGMTYSPVGLFSQEYLKTFGLPLVPGQYFFVFFVVVVAEPQPACAY